MNDEGFGRLLILGASARAAAMSAQRAGVTPVCGDMFGDEDLRAIAQTHVVADYPRGLIAVADAIPPSDWLYTGALENSPRLIARISRRHRLLGNPPAVLKRARDPLFVMEALNAAGLPALRVRPQFPGILDNLWEPAVDPNGRKWLVKPRRGGGGRGIRFWNPDKADPVREPVYLQEFAAGTPISGLFLASRLNCRLVGITRQLIGESELHAPPFVYCGSIGPLRFPAELTSQVERIGRVLAEACDLRGLFGVDCILRDGVVLVTEVNPRYTASVEIIELAADRPLLGWHRRACESFGGRAAAVAAETELNDFWSSPANDGEAVSRIVGKAVWFSPQSAENFTVSRMDDELPPIGSGDAKIPVIADVSRPGSLIPPGSPICTVFTAAETVAECLNSLFERVRTLQLVSRL